MPHFLKKAGLARLAVLFVLINLLLAACGPSGSSATPTIQNVSSTTQNAAGTTSGNGTASTSPQPGTTASTSAAAGVTTPPVYSGLAKGKLKEMFPVLTGLTEAKAVRINDDWTGLTFIYPYLAHYSLERKTGQFEGEGVFSIGSPPTEVYESRYYGEATKVINIPIADAQKFLQMLADAPVEEGKYKGSPIPTHTDDYPTLNIFVETGFGTLQIYSHSQEKNFYPFSFYFAGREFTGTDAVAFDAFSLLKQYLQKNTIKELLDAAGGGNKSPTTPSVTANPGLTPVASQNSALPSLLSPVFDVLSQPGHTSYAVTNIAVSPDGQVFATGGDGTDGTIRLWNNSGQLLKILRGSNDSFAGLRFSPDGKILASSGNRIKLWEVASGRQLASFDLNGDTANLVSFTSDGKTLVSSDMVVFGKRQIRLWDAISYKFIRSLEGSNAVALPSSNLIVFYDGFAASPGTVKFYNLDTQQTTSFPNSNVTANSPLAISPDGKQLAAEQQSGKIQLWELPSGNEIKTILAPPVKLDLYSARIGSLEFSPDGKYLAGTRLAENLIKVWQVADGKEVASISADKSYFLPISFSADSQNIFAVGASISQYDLKGNLRFKVENNRSNVNALALSHDGQSFATGTYGKEVKLWNTTDGKSLAVFTGLNVPVKAVAISPNGRYVAGAGGDDYDTDGDPSIKLWDVQSKNPTPVLNLPGHYDMVQALAFSPDGQILASGSNDRTIRLWEIPSGRLLGQLKGKVPEFFQFYTITFSPDGKTIAGAGSGDSASKNYPVKIWDVASGQELASLKGHTGNVRTLAFSPDGKTLASAGDDGSVRLWEVASKKEQSRLDPQAKGGTIYSVAFSQDGKRLATCHQNGLLALWDTSSGKEISDTIAQTFSGPFYLAFTPDGQFIITGHQKDTALKRWQVK